jgi:hypothetical protein
LEDSKIKVMDKVIWSLCFFFFGYTTGKGQSTFQEYKVIHDTLRVIVPECEGDSLINMYYDMLGIKISNYYRPIDSLDMNINNDGVLDRILILSPVTQGILDTLTCEEKPKKRLLITLISSGSKGHHLEIINDNVILNTFDFQGNPYQGIKKITNGFRLSFEFGSIIFCEFKFDFVCKKGEFLLQKSSYYCFNKGNPDLYKIKSNTYKSKKYFLKNIDINQFIDIPDLLEKK